MLRFLRKILIFLIFFIFLGYVSSVVIVYKRMQVNHKIYLHVVDAKLGETVTPLPIPHFLELILWKYLGGREDILNKQMLDGKPFLFLMNLRDDVNKNETVLVIKENEKALAKALLCIEASKNFIDYYSKYAQKTDNHALSLYLEEFKNKELCN